MSLNSRVAVITGATGALGRVVVKLILGQGAHVVSVYRSEEMQKELAEYVGEVAETLTSIQADVTNESNVQALFQRVITKYGRVDILLNIVGAYRGGTEKRLGIPDERQPEIGIPLLQSSTPPHDGPELR